MSAIYWLTSLVALAGVLLNIHGRVAAFYLWACTNAVWVYADLAHGHHPQAALMAAYFCLSLYGIWKWSRARKEVSDGEENSR